jgi:phage FluMu gp28-like protein
MTGAQGKAIVQWHPWQRRLFADTSRVEVVNWHRQAGKDFCAAGKAVDHALRTGQDWFIVSITQRQADATFAKARTFADIFKRALKAQAEATVSEREYVEHDRRIDQAFRCTARTLHLPGGGSVTALPGRDPDTLAGLTGNVIFTEFGLFPRGGYDHWRVVFPLTTRGYQVLVISTPRGKNTKFYELASEPETYSYHFQPITHSIAEGLELRDNKGKLCSLERFRKLYGDPVGFQREYMCEFTGDLESLLKWAQLENAAALGENPWYRFDCLDMHGERAVLPQRFFAPSGDETGRIEWGWDIARHGHLSALWGNLAAPGRPKALRYLVLMREVPFALQRHVAQAAMDSRGGNVGCGDATGLGMDSNETLENRYGKRWRGVTFTAATKRDLASRLATIYDEGSQALPPWGATAAIDETATDTLPISAKAIATDLYAIQADRGGANLALSESSNPMLPESHCDIAWSGALALEAGAIAAASPGCMLL